MALTHEYSGKSHPLSTSEKGRKMREHYRDRDPAVRAASRVVEVALKNCYCGSEYAGLEDHLKSLPGIVDADLDRTRSVIHLEYAPNVVDRDSIEAELENGGYRCDCRNRPEDHKEAADHAAMHEDEHAGHGAAMVRDMLRRAIFSALLTVPIILFSPVGESLGFTTSPPFGLSMGLLGFTLTTPVVFWGGWVLSPAPGAHCCAARRT